MRYDKNELGHCFRNSDVPLSAEEIEKNSGIAPSNNKVISTILIVISIASIVFPKLFKKLVIPGSVEAQLLLCTGVFIFASAILIAIPNPKVSRKQQKNMKIAGVFVGITGFATGIITFLKISNKFALNVSEDTALSLIAIVCGIAAILCFFGGLIAFIGSKTKYRKTTRAVCVGFDDKIGLDRSMSVVFSCPVYEFMHENNRYLVYEDRYDVASKMPKIDDSIEIRFNEVDPTDCTFGKIKKGLFPMIIAFPLIVMCVAILIPILRDRSIIQIGGSSSVTSQVAMNEASDYYKKFNRFSLDDKFILDVLEMDGKKHDFEIYVRKLVSIDGDKLVFEQIEGLDSSADNHYSDAKEGEEYYWIERDDGLILVLKKSAYAYNGNKLKE